MILRRVLAVVGISLGLASLALPATATTILSVSGPHGSTLSLGSGHQALVASWSSTSAYSGVNVSFQSNFGPFAGTAYLMTQIGPGTTSAQQIAVASYSATSSTPALTSLFSGLTLGAGTYYLVLTSTSAGGWDTPYTAGPAVVSLAPGVTRGAQFIVNDGSGVPDLSYFPASSFSALTTFYDLEFEVTGSLVPEPSRLLLLGVGLALLPGTLRRSSGSRLSLRRDRTSSGIRQQH
jgi:hypothetical protein